MNDLPSRELEETLVAMLRRARTLPDQTMRHVQEHAGTDDALAAFLAAAASELEDYELEITFGPVFTPRLEEQVVVSPPLMRFRPSAEDVETIIARLAAGLESCPIRLPGGGTASLALHEVLIERYVTLLHLDRAPAREVVEALDEALPETLRDLALALARSSSFTPRHQEWLARFLPFAAGRQPVSDEAIVILAEFLGSQRSLETRDLAPALDGLLRAAIDAGSFVQQGRKYWSSDVAEHHHFRGQGSVDEAEVGRRMREVEILERFRADLESFGDVFDGLGAASP